MGRFIAGDIVVVPFPFSDLSSSKRRPAFVIRDFEGEDVLLCQITSKSVKNDFAVSLEQSNFKSGGLNKKSNIRPDKIFTCSRNIILYKIGVLNSKKSQSVLKEISKIILNS